MKTEARRQRGSFVLGMVVGLLVGLALALGVALYITKAPVPFIDKVPQRTVEQDNAEAEHNRNWNPNAALNGRSPPPQAAPAAGADPVAAAMGDAPPPGPRPGPRDPGAILAGAAVLPPEPEPEPEPPRRAAAGARGFVYYVQAGAFTRSEDAEQQRGRLAMLGQTARITEREQAGRTVYRVRVGPYPAREEADALQSRLQEQSIEAQIVRVERP